MQITRRRFLAATAAAGTLLPAGARRLWAATALDLGGGATLETLSDGTLVLPASFVLGDLPADAAGAILAAAGLEPAAQFTAPCNVTLFRDGARTVLFDAGAGRGFVDSAGRLPEALDAIGLAPEEVTHVLFTHGHPDHLWGILDEFEEPLFPSAELVMGRLEHAYWTDPATAETIGPMRAGFAAGAARRLEVLGDAVRLVEDGEEVLPGITARLTPGHTPGHMAFAVGAAGGQALVLGDAVGNHHLAFARPDWPAPSDQDAAAGAATRAALLAELAGSGVPIVGFHLPDGGIGRVGRGGAEGGYRFIAA
ncbi:MAG: MBL fold metallo-hydrolase [Rhodobacteraceae bacterium]|nr:MBL fold metallo-hydrolase [Paracoccaceae bacterium]